MWHTRKMEYYLAIRKRTDTCYRMDILWKHAIRKKPVTKDHTLYKFIYMKCPE